MRFETDLSIATRDTDRDLRLRMGKLHALVADRDLRTAKLVKRILFSFGLRNIELTTNGEHAMHLLRSLPFDFLITEWDMHPLDGITLVREIRAAREDKRIKRDIAIIMLTGQTDINSIQLARDAGITEFIAKPFNAKTVSNRLVRIIDQPRAFVATDNYAGPCRRRRGEPPPGVEDRRQSRTQESGNVTPPDFSLREQLGVVSATDIINEMVIQEAQLELMQAESEFVAWAETDIENLRHVFMMLELNPKDALIQQKLVTIAYAIQSQAGIFGYHLGTEVAGMLVTYAKKHRIPTQNHLTVIGKHIDVIGTVFNLKVEQEGHTIAKELIGSLHKLVTKLA